MRTIRPKLLFLILVIYIVSNSFSELFSATLELLPATDGTYRWDESCQYLSGCSTSQYIVPNEISLLYVDTSGYGGRGYVVYWGQGLIEFDLSSAAGLFTSGNFQAFLILKHKAGRPDGSLYIKDMNDANEDGSIAMADVNNTTYITSQDISSLQLGDVLSIDVTSAIEHDLFAAGQTLFSGFVLDVSYVGDYDVAFYDSYDGENNAPRLRILSGEITTTTSIIPSTTTTTTTPAISFKQQVAAGDFHTVGLKADGSVVAVGFNYLGQCNVSDWHNIAQVEAGYGHTVGLKIDGSVVAVGDHYYGQCNISDWSGIVQVAAGDNHTVGVKAEGSVVAVGNNPSGQCNVTGWSNIVNVAAGTSHTVGLKTDGSVVAVGNNYSGQCNVSGWTGIVQVAAGLRHTIGLKSNGSVVAVGYNGYGECNVSDWSGIVQVAAGAEHTVGLKADGSVVAVGNNGAYGQCNVSGWSNIVNVAAGEHHTVGLKADGSVVAVGDNYSGQCNVSLWDLSGGVPPTLINLSSFTAAAKFSNVIIEWNTESEIDNAGFNLYRSTSETGEYLKINDSLIPAQGSTTQGVSYEFVDREVKNRKLYYYKLEDIDINGVSTMHGPVSATPRWIWGIFGIFGK